MFKDYADKWLETYVKALRRITTYERYRDMLARHVYPAPGNLRIDEIKRSEIRDLLLRLHANGLSKSTVCLARDAISGPLAYAFDEELIAANPVTGITKRLQLHGTRHSYAGILLSLGVSPVYVKEQLGHSSIQITVDCYGHFMPSGDQATINRLDTQLPATYPQPLQTKEA